MVTPVQAEPLNKSALAHFERHPEDPPALAYAGQCRKHLTAPEAWDGIRNLAEK